MNDDRILIRNLRVQGIIGLNEIERTERQEILINVILYTDVRTAGASDDGADILNYRTVAKDIIRYVEGSAHFLVEALATAIARLCVVEHHAARVTVCVEKPGAVRSAESVGVEITRDRSDFE